MGQLTVLLPARGTQRVSSPLARFLLRIHLLHNKVPQLSPGQTNGRVIARASKKGMHPAPMCGVSRGGKYARTFVIPAATVACAAGWAGNKVSEKAGRLRARNREGRKRRKWDVWKCHIFFTTLWSSAQIPSILPCSHCK